MVVLRDIDIESHCEHHIAPFLGKAWVAYLPTDKVVGISKLVKVVEIFSKRLQTQETMTAQIADAIEDALKPRGCAVMIDAQHQCMSTLFRSIKASNCPPNLFASASHSLHKGGEFSRPSEL